MRLPPLAGPAALLALAASLAAAAPARAAYTVTFSQVGPDVVASGSGTIDVNGLTVVGLAVDVPPQVVPSLAAETTGMTSIADNYLGAISGPSSFGSGAATNATTGTGDLVGIQQQAFGGGDSFYVPQGYVSGAPLSDTATYAGQTFASLGLTPGSYVYGFGSGANADTITINIAAAPVPEPASLALLGTGLAGLGLVRRKRA